MTMAKAKQSTARRSKLSGTSFAIPQTVVFATYLCTNDVPGCTRYVVDHEYEVLVTEPAPQMIVVSNQGACNGTILQLI
jgi:hypothetical protein